MSIIKIYPIESEPIPSLPSDPNSKDWAMIKSMLGLARKKPQHNLVPIEFHKITRQTKLALIMVPEWGVFFPPYNLSRIAGVTASAGYETKVYDVNVKSWKRLLKTTSIDFWDPDREWMWQGNWYSDKIHPLLEPILQEYVDLIAKTNPSVIGFSLYYTNEIPTNWMAQRLKKLLPNTKIIAGGPQTLCLNEGTEKYYDYIIQGEGEQLVLNLLDAIENNNNQFENKYLKASPTRLDLDSLPFPDYSHYDLNEYRIPNGISAELSRGCVASCVFCTEVHFWKYRGRMSGTVLDEIEYQYKTYGIDFVWFIDSLVNGNLNELRAFAQGVIERKLKIHWQGYARCDRRMDIEYYKDLARSGCRTLDYGIESGNQKVLTDMKKSITIADIESNLKNSHSVGISNATNWIVGFPTETIQGFSDTLTLTWRMQSYINHMSTGLTMMLSPGSTITKDEAKYNISPYDFQGAWATFDLTNTKLHRLVRQKTFLIFLQHLKTRNTMSGLNRPALDTLYSIEYTPPEEILEITYEDFDYNIIKSNISLFADSLMNEIWPLFRTLWRVVGTFKMTVKFIPDEDLREWGDRLAGNYTSTHQFEIDSQGNWHADFKYKFVQESEIYTGSPWSDQSFEYHWDNLGSWIN